MVCNSNGSHTGPPMRACVRVFVHTSVCVCVCVFVCECVYVIFFRDLALFDWHFSKVGDVCLRVHAYVSSVSFCPQLQK
jgi:hypothetical protein